MAELKFPTLEEFGRQAGEWALDEFEYKGHTIREWVDKITTGEYQPVLNCCFESRGVKEEHLGQESADKKLNDYRARLEASKEYAERLLTLLKLLNDDYTPDGISNEELENLFETLDELDAFIKELNNGGADG